MQAAGNAGRSAAGFSLIELIVTLTLLATVAGAVLLFFGAQAGRSVDPVLRGQALAVARAYLEEITLKAFDDPDGVDNEGAARAVYDDVDDYNGLPDDRVRDQDGSLVPALADYRVTVAVTPYDIAGIGAANGLRIDVRVRHALVAEVDLLLTGIRTRY